MTYALAYGMHFQGLFGREDVMKKKLLPLMLLAGGSVFASTHFSIGVGVGTPGYYAPSAAVAVRPPCPGPGYSWVDGYYDPYGAWIAGYWAAPVNTYVAPYYGRGFDRDDHWFRDRDDYRFRDRDNYRFRGRDDHDRGRVETHRR
jgi:hypothetical protein